MKASKHNDLNLIWENYMQEEAPAKSSEISERAETFEQHSIEDLVGRLMPLTGQLDPESEYNIKRFLAMTISDLGGSLHEANLNEEMTPSKDELTDSEKEKLQKYAKDNDDEEDEESDVTEEGSDSFGYNQGKGDHWKEYRKKFDDDPGYQQLRNKMQAEYDAKKNQQEAEANPEFSQPVWMLMKGDPSTNTVKVVKKYTGVDDEGAVQQLSTMLADLTAEQDGLPRDEHFPFETDTGHEFFQSEVADGVIVKRVIAIDEDYDLIYVEPDTDY